MSVKSSDIFILFFFKALNTEIKARRETIEGVLKDNEACVHSIKVGTSTCNTFIILFYFPAFMTTYL